MDYSKKLPLSLYEWTLQEMKISRSHSYTRLLADMVAKNKDLFTELELRTLRYAYTKTCNLKK